MKKTLLTILAGLLSANLSAQELPKVNEEDMHWLIFDTHPNGQPNITKGYDTDGDKLEDTRFHYEVFPLANGAFAAQLTAYAIDKNKDGYFTDDEWIEYKPETKKKEQGGMI